MNPNPNARAPSESPVTRLLALEPHGIALGLDVINTLCGALNHPEGAFSSVIVAGTNGKGSVAATIETALRAAGARTGLYTSPHLLSLEERFAIDGKPVSRTDLERGARVVLEAIDQLQATAALGRPVTFFEATTAMAFLLFREAGVHTAVLEVGMGGRFDATNIVTPTCAVITTIDIDHAEFLGDTIPEIAFEKAGVIAPGVPVITGETNPQAVAVLRDVARERGARFVSAADDVAISTTLRDGVAFVTMKTPVRQYGPVQLALAGSHQVANAAVAVRALESITLDGAAVPASAIQAGLERVQWPGRLERVEVDPGRWLVLDAAHNTAAARALARFLTETYATPPPLVFGALRDKDVAGMTRALASAIARMVCVPVRSQRGLPADELARIARAAVPTLDATTASTPAAGLQDAWRSSATICVAGSLYLVAEVMQVMTGPERHRPASTRRPG